MKLHELHADIRRRFDSYDERLGQALFNALAAAGVPGIEDLRGSLDDPFYRVKTSGTLSQWCNKHLLVDDDGTIVAVV